MKVTMELSLYPIADDYLPPIHAFIHHLRYALDGQDAQVVTNQMSTQLRGELSVLMPAVESATQAVFESGQKASLVMKLLNSELDILRVPDV